MPSGSPPAAAAVPALTPPTGAATSVAGAPFALGVQFADPSQITALDQIRHADASTLKLPASVDLTPLMPPVGNQGAENSCVAWAVGYAVLGYEAREDKVWNVPASTSAPAYNFSPAFVYNQIDGGVDQGATIPSAFALIGQQGAATLADMPYVAGQYRTQPSAAALADAKKYKLASFGYIAPTDLTTIKSQLNSGFTVVIAIKVYANFFSLGPNKVYTAIGGAYQGGHAVTVVGYDDSKQALKFINSWGTGWGSAGYGWISYGVVPTIVQEAYSTKDVGNT